MYSLDNTLREPSELTYTPLEYIDRSGVPLVGESCSYLSSKYDRSIDGKILSSLGVHVLDLRAFLAQSRAILEILVDNWSKREARA